MTPTSILIVGGLEPLGIGLVNSLHIKHGQDVQLTIYGNPHPETNLNNIPEKLFNDEARFRIVYGGLENELLIGKTIRDFQVDCVIHVPSGLCDPAHQDPDSVSSARTALLGITHLMDAIRKTTTVKVLIQMSTLKVYGETFEEQAHATNGQISPGSPFAASLIGAEAMLHSYAMSYRMNIKIVRIPDTVFWGHMPEEHIFKAISKDTAILLDENDKMNLLSIDDVTNALMLLSGHTQGVAEIFDLAGSKDVAVQKLKNYFKKITPLETIPTILNRDKILSIGWNDSIQDAIEFNAPSNPQKPALKFLVYGGKGWIGQQFVQILEVKGLDYVLAETRPGDDREDLIVEEFLRVAPSHVVSFLGRTHGPDKPNIDYLEGGSDKLHINVRDNLYAPWTLANLCEKTLLGTGCLFEYNEQHGIGGVGYTENDTPTFTGNKYSVVKGFTDRSLKFFDKTLNVRIRYPFNDEDSGRNLLRKLMMFNKIIDIPNSITYLPGCLPILVDMCMKQTTGTINLVNPGPISFPKMLEIYQEVSGKKLDYEVEKVNPAVPMNRAHCTLDTTKVQEMYPQILTSEEAVRVASKNLKIN